MQAVVAPEKIRYTALNLPLIFLAGSIDQGDTVDWQSQVTKDYEGYDIGFLNPRRPNWDKNATDSEVREQIYWEMDGLANSDSIIIYFHPDSKAPISLLELGMHIRDKKVVVVCPPGYWRRTNVQVVCSRFDVPVFNDLDEGMRQAVVLAIHRFNSYGGPK